ncbi:hypothetical protein DIJ64_03085 [Mycobacterium leprae]|uniref:Uncharacterized protein n=1 Tax=Mycobacterium leprae TaxID=1769 RepID=A0AAD0KRQ3_MYCLR|nr:hypothetical protein [Mycobacterium leprae]AWV47442.1 hypothetical protein DIJ64_03085 [Mycobacterium leprae]OAR20186.1 hypothetical protein A8144_02680 [Mycobacterium leprae 3125609]OAX71633.1 hypothetical protein A3216_04270 [Mycobacterium leprae 7935681]
MLFEPITRNYTVGIDVCPRLSRLVQGRGGRDDRSILVAHDAQPGTDFVPRQKLFDATRVTQADVCWFVNCAVS